MGLSLCAAALAFAVPATAQARDGGATGEQSSGQAPGTVWRATVGPVGLTAQAGTDTVETVVAPPIDCAFLKFRDAESKALDQPLQFAEPHAVDLRVDGKSKWTSLPEDNLLWRKRFVVPGALGVNIGMRNVSLPPGAKLFVYSEESGDVFGPYTSAHNRPHRELWTPVVPGENVVLEVSLPADSRNDFSLDVSAVNGSYRDFYKLLAEKQGNCNIDVVCSEGDPWRREIRSAGVYSVSGTFLCSGTMVMNERRDFRNYFLTAYHCGVSSRNAASMVVYWNFESPTCGQLGGGSLAQYTAGATFRASYSASDFCLVELNQSPDPAFGVYYAGWERGGIAPAKSVCIHHPGCDEKAISFVNTALRSTAYLSNTESADANHWRVVAWDLGTTEPGSSGSGLWNAATRRLVGQLHGGYSSCAAITASDWYGKISSSWTGGGLSTSRLSDWLDPDGTGVTGVDGGDPTGDDNYENNDSLATAYDFSTEQTWLSSVAGQGVQLDEDWYKILVWPAGNERVQIDCRFQHAAGDIDIGLYDATNKLLAYSYGIWDNEFVEYTVPTAGVYYIKVSYANHGNTYDLWWDDMPPLAEPMPDLVVKSMTHTPSEPEPGTVVTFSATVKNQGTAAAAPAFSLGFWSNLSSAPSIATAPEQDADCTTLAAGASTVVTFSVTAPAAGTYTARAFADRWSGTSEVAEGNEDNNAGPAPSGYSWTVVAPPQPDLLVKSITVSPTNPTPGTTVSFTVTVTNQGTSAASPSFSLGFWSARTSAPEISTTAEKSASLGTIAAGAVSTVVFTATAPTAGTYTAWAYADRGASAVAESVETNNAGPLPSGFSWTVRSGATAYPNGVPPNVPGRIEMEKFDKGGQGVAYLDTYGTVNGSTYRPGELVDLAKATTANNGWYVRDAVAGEWLNYTVNATAAGSYKLAVRYKSAKAGGTFHIECDGVPVSGTLTVKATATLWQSLTVTGVPLSAGTHQIRVVLDKNGLGGTVALFDSMTFSVVR
jgi:hypothetical protein